MPFHEDVTPVVLARDLQPLYLSSRPGYSDFPASARKACERFIKDAISDRIRVVVVLMTSEEILRFYGTDIRELYRGSGMEVVDYPIEDGWTPEDLGSFHHLMRDMLERLKSGRVLVHCNAGLGRTGTVAAGLLICSGMTAEAAISAIRRTRPGAVQNRWQEDFLQRYGEGIRRP